MEQQLVVGSVVENPDLTKWDIVDDLPVGVVREFVFSRALGAPIGPKGTGLEYPALRYLSEDESSWDAHWRNLAAVVVVVNSVTREVYAIVRHGPTFRLIRLREQAKP